MGKQISSFMRDAESYSREDVHVYLSLLGRGVAHDVNNVTSVLRAVIYLAGLNRDGVAVASDAMPPSLLSEIASACDRLEILCDQLLLSDPDSGPARVPVDAEAVLRDALRILPSFTEAPVQVRGTLEGALCSMPASLLRAAVLRILNICARHLSVDQGIQVELAKDAPGGNVVIQVMAPVGEGVLSLDDPLGSLSPGEIEPTSRLGISLWHVARSAQGCGGRLALAHVAGNAVLTLHLPTLGSEPPGSQIKSRG